LYLHDVALIVITRKYKVQWGKQDELSGDKLTG